MYKTKDYSSVGHSQAFIVKDFRTMSCTNCIRFLIVGFFKKFSNISLCKPNDPNDCPTFGLRAIVKESL